MKCLATMNAFTHAIPNAVISVTTGWPKNGPATLTTSRPHRIAQIRT
jgi:hypothetical protein